MGTIIFDNGIAVFAFDDVIDPVTRENVAQLDAFDVFGPSAAVPGAVAREAGDELSLRELVDLLVDPVVDAGLARMLDEQRSSVLELVES
jgi:hypothetical protein